MEVIFKVLDDILIARVKGDVDHHNAAPVRNAIDTSMEAFGCKDLIMDLSGVDFMDSSGIGVVLGRYKKLAGRGGHLCISGCTGHMERVLDMAGVFTLVPKEPELQGAVDLMQRHGQNRAQDHGRDLLQNYEQMRREV